MGHTLYCDLLGLGIYFIQSYKSPSLTIFKNSHQWKKKQQEFWISLGLVDSDGIFPQLEIVQCAKCCWKREHIREENNFPLELIIVPHKGRCTVDWLADCSILAKLLILPSQSFSHWSVILFFSMQEVLQFSWIFLSWWLRKFKFIQDFLFKICHHWLVTYSQVPL